MIIKPPYILDANTFMEASRKYYQFRFAKPFWDGLVNYAEKSFVMSIDKVLQEIKNGDKEDLLKKWATAEFKNHFKDTQTSEVVQIYADLMQWAANETQYQPRAKDVFMDDDNADAWVIAYAKAYDCTIVTHEVGSAQVQRNIPIPNVCDAFNIAHCTTFTMLEKLGFSF
jgi:hypothetical protein